MAVTQISLHGVSPRVATALVLAPLILAVCCYGNTQLFAGVCALAALVGIWEWGRLAGLTAGRGRPLLLLCGALLLGVLYANMGVALALSVAAVAMLWWLVALVLALRVQRGAAFNPSRSVLGAIGLLVLTSAWVSLTALHAPTAPGAPVLVVCLLLIVWAADIAAYYVGRRWGRNQLAALISPGKTWEGLSGALCVGLMTATVAYGWLLSAGRHRFSLFLFICTVTILLSVLGDLTESLVKRAGGVKDSGRLLPGHGGVLDRIDSLCAAAPTFFLGVWWLERGA